MISRIYKTCVSVRFTVPPYHAYARQTRQLHTSVRCQRSAEWSVEDYRRRKRVTYDFDSWTKQRNQDRYIGNFASLFSDSMYWGISRPTSWCVGVSVVLGLYETAVANGELPPMFHSLTWSHASIMTLTSFALSLLLVFRTNSSYGRFNEARKMWGLVTNRSRDLARQVVSYFPEECQQQKAAVGRWLVAFARSLRTHVQGEGDLAADLGGLLTREELDILLSADHRPIMALTMISQIINSMPTSTAASLQMSGAVTVFHDQLGGCERILRTPIPLSYTRHTERFLMIWLTMLPFALWNECGWATPMLELLTSTLLLGIDAIAIFIEEPFGILPLDGMCDKIERDVSAILRSEAQLAPHIAQYTAAMLAAAGVVSGSNGNGVHSSSALVSSSNSSIGH